MKDAPTRRIASLEATFQRHHKTAAELLTPTTAQAFAKNDRQRRASDQRTAAFERRQSFAPPSDSGRRTRLWRNSSSELLAELISQRGTNAQHVDARRCIVTDDEYTCALPLMPETLVKAHDVLIPLIENGLVPVMGGFIASTTEGTTTTLRRGGSDYTAALIGAALPADEIQIWTDVTGVLAADPRVVPEAQTVERLSYAEASETCLFRREGVASKDDSTGNRRAYSGAHLQLPRARRDRHARWTTN